MRSPPSPAPSLTLPPLRGREGGGHVRERVCRPSVRQPVELGGVLAGDLADRLGTDVVDQLGADRVELEGRAALAAPILTRLQLHQVAEAVLELEIHAVQ